MLAIMQIAAAPLTVEQGLDEALTEVTYLSFDRAYNLFNGVLAEVPEGSATWQQAVYGKAVCAQQMTPASPERMREAAGLYQQQLLAKTPDSKFAPRAMMNLGRIAELVDYTGDTSDLATARDWYQKVVDRFPGLPIAGEAALRIAGTYIQTYQKDQVTKGIEIVSDWLKAHPQDPLASAMWQYLGDSYYDPLGDFANSLDCYRKADAIGLVEKGREGRVYWRMAVLADRLKNRDVAVEYYTKIITKTATSGKAYEAQVALKRLGAPVPEIQLFNMVSENTPAPASQPAATQPSKEVSR